MNRIRHQAGSVLFGLASLASLVACGSTAAPAGLPATFTGEQGSGSTQPASESVGGTNLSGNKYVGPNEAFKSIQAAVHAAAPGETIVVRAGTYREKVLIDKSLTLLGERGAVVKGSEVFPSWRPEREFWVADYPYQRDTFGDCQKGSNRRCLKPDQVFVNGEPQFQETNPGAVGPGDFYVGNGKIFLGSDPGGKTVEVSVRDAWIVGQGPSGVTIKGLSFAHAAAPTQTAGLQANGPRWLIEGNDIAHSHSTGLSMNGDGTIARNNFLHHNGQNGITGRGANMVVDGNRISHNNTEEYDVQWEGGGSKWATARNLTVSNNEAFNNDGPGLWCDVGCDTVTFSGNRVHHNKHQGIHFEVSRNAVIRDNVTWENGHDYKIWPLGAGILVQNSSNVRVHGNVVAWNGDGIGVIQGSRGDDTLMRDVSIYENVIAGAEGNLLGVVSNADDSVFQSWTNNKAHGNRYYRSGSANWAQGNQDLWDLGQLNGTVLGGNSSSVDRSELDRILGGKGVPLQPKGR